MKRIRIYKDRGTGHRRPWNWLHECRSTADAGGFLAYVGNGFRSQPSALRAGLAHMRTCRGIRHYKER